MFCDGSCVAPVLFLPHSLNLLGTFNWDPKGWSMFINLALERGWKSSALTQRGTGDAEWGCRVPFCFPVTPGESAQAADKWRCMLLRAVPTAQERKIKASAPQMCFSLFSSVPVLSFPTCSLYHRKMAPYLFPVYYREMGSRHTVLFSSLHTSAQAMYVVIRDRWKLSDVLAGPDMLGCDLIPDACRSVQLKIRQSK